MQIRELMTANPACCTPDASLQEVARMMRENDCGLIPVVESHSNKKPLGTVTDRDIAIRAVATGGDGAAMKASDIMTTGVAAVRPDMSVEECFDVMEDREVRRVLVLDGEGKLTGIVAQADIVQSNANPTRTNKVIREISESAPSRHQAGSMQTTSSGLSSVFSGRGLYPFVTGLASGVGLAYLLGNWGGESEHGYGGGRVSTHSHENHIVNAVNTEGFGKYADAEREVENRRGNLEDRVHALRTDADSPIVDRSDYTTGPDDATNQTRAAGQGG